MKKCYQITRTRLLAKYGGLSLYDIGMDKRYSIYDKYIHFVKGDGYALISNPEHPDRTSIDHEYFFIHDDLFEIILETDHNYDITLM